MNWLNRAESKYGHLAIPNLPGMLVGLNALTYVLLQLSPEFGRWLTLDMKLVLQGEVWRLISYIFVPSFGSGIFGGALGLLLYLCYIWMIGSGVEQAIGSFRFNVYYFLGMLGTTLAAAITDNGSFSNGALNGSLFFAFARFYPEQLIYIMYILPVKVKWVAWVMAFFTLMAFLGGGAGERLAILASLSNYLIFFGGEIFQDARHRSEVAVRRQKFDRDIRDAVAEPLHKCVICGQTDESNPELDFRVSSLDGQEYCTVHLPKPSAAGANS